ncbi:MAG TPA: AbrB family transcriptional regulator [Rhodanobacteraceae bacterium]|nr:AbrB family transcriptional regulator [Rhodanobacteraceae bacterium]
MTIMRHVRLFRNGSNQAVRIPRDMELDADEAVLHREGNRLVLEPIPPSPLLALLETLKPIDDEFPDVDAGLPRMDDIQL